MLIRLDKDWRDWKKGELTIVPDKVGKTLRDYGWASEEFEPKHIDPVWVLDYMDNRVKIHWGLIKKEIDEHLRKRGQ